MDAPRDFDNPGPRSLALDSSGRPRIAYGKDRLYYAWYDGSAWRVETVDSPGAMGWHPSLALDGSGHSHIGYQMGFRGDRKYAYHDGSAWFSPPARTERTT